jgi:succinoglycan biosynthesis protein ExoL
MLNWIDAAETALRKNASLAHPEALLAEAPVVAFFGHDSNEPTIVKRMQAFSGGGARVVAFTFTRRRPGAVPAERFENIHLGFTEDRNYLRRLPQLMRGAAIAIAKFEIIRNADVIYARNIDMALIACIAKLLSASRAPFVYEVLDVQRIFLGDKLVNRIFRFIERRIMDMSSLLVVSSPMFMEKYFHFQQNYRGAWRLLENKISSPGGLPNRIAPRDPPPAPPWRIGWHGRLRCPRSLEILCEIADRLGDKVFIDLRGAPSEEDLPSEKIERLVASRRNMAYGGAYERGDLANIYAGVHFSWCVDFLDAGSNSDWLLPNRIYEGGLFGAIALTRSGTATAKKAEGDRLGFAFRDPLSESVANFLEGLAVEDYAAFRDNVKNMPRSKFVDTTDSVELLHSIIGRRPAVRASFG